MVILGIDPGTRRVGYGVVLKTDGSLACLAAGILPISARDDYTALLEIKQGLMKVIKKFSPRVLAIEKLFFSRNQKTALRVSEARGVLILTAHEQGLRIIEYTPNEVKLGVTGYGHADKKTVLKMVQLTLRKPDLKLIDDASDALALAILAATDAVHNPPC